MDWKNALKDEPPQNGQEVLIAVRGVYYAATYNEDLGGFQIEEYPNFFSLKEVTVYWAEIPQRSNG